MRERAKKVNTLDRATRSGGKRAQRASRLEVNAHAGVLACGTRAYMPDIRWRFRGAPDEFFVKNAHAPPLCRPGDRNAVQL